MFPKTKHVVLLRKQEKDVTIGVEWNQSTDTWIKRMQGELAIAESAKWNQTHDAWTKQEQGV